MRGKTNNAVVPKNGARRVGREIFLAEMQSGRGAAQGKIAPVIDDQGHAPF